MDTRFARTWAKWTCAIAGHLWLVAIHLNGDVTIAAAYLLLTVGLLLELLEGIQGSKNNRRADE